MVLEILRQVQHLDASPHAPQHLTWDEVEAMTRRLKAKTNLIVPKSALSTDPPYRRSGLGRKRGAENQYRCHRGHYNLHIKEFDTHWVVHVDRYNPHLHVIRHLLVDHGYKVFLHIAELFVPPAVAGDAWAQQLYAAPAPTPA